MIDMPGSAGPNRGKYRRGAWWAVCLTVGTVAFLARLVPVLRSGGLSAINAYDAAIYFGAAVGLTHGRLPYRDFLLLHPPGSTLALAPFAALAQTVGDGIGWASARIAMMVLGALTAVLVAQLLRPLGLASALLGGLCYAVFLPAVTIEVTTRLEPLAAPCLVGALLLLSVDEPRMSLQPRPLLLAGALLGFATTVKIWGAVPLLVAAVYLLGVAGLLQSAWFVAGAAAVGVAVCLPFLLAAPGPMWRQVVSDQFGREESNRSSLERVADITGLQLIWDHWTGRITPLLIAAVVLIVVAAVLAFRVVQGRLAVLMLGALVAVQLSTPLWLPHYAGLSAGVMAIVVGAAAAVALSAVKHPAWRAVVTGFGGLVLLAAAAQLSQARFGEQFPAKQMAAAVDPLQGCITADDPGVLLGMDTLSRNLRRGCPLVLDLGGYSYDYRPQIRRVRDPRWQRFFLDYMASGTVTLNTRYHTGFGLTRDSARTLRRWPVIYQADGFELRQPPR
jgi:hypothetical protein